MEKVKNQSTKDSNFTKGFMCLSTSGNYTQVEILTGNI